MPAIRPLPPRPSLEYERKQAKRLLRRLRAANPEALLADAQLIIAREYGFASWPRLVRFFGDIARQQAMPRQLHARRETLEGSVRSLLSGHGTRRPASGRMLAAYVPRFYGVRPAEVFARPVTEDDARLAVARSYGAPSWEVLLERLADAKPGGWEVDPIHAAAAAIAAGDLGALDGVVAAHPELLRPTPHDAATRRTLIALAVGQEQKRGVAAMRPIIDWLAARGFDRQDELNLRLCGHVFMRRDEVRDLLDRGADPDWVAPNGIPVLEHALLRYWNAEAVDLLAARATRRNALWIAAGLGDVEGVRRFLDRSGRPTTAARRLRPDFDAAGPNGMLPRLPDADDEEILVEAFLVATLNGRTDVLEYMAGRGVPLDSMIYGTPVINFAVGNGWTRVVECLVRCGADLDLRGTHPNQSAREMARGLFEDLPDDPERRRIAELCGLDPVAVLAERDARQVPPPRLLPDLEKALALAEEDAARLGQQDVSPVNLLVGLMRIGGPPLEVLRNSGRTALTRVMAALSERLRSVAESIAPPGPAAAAELSLSTAAHAAVNAAIAFATERRSDVVDGLHLLLALAADATVAAFLDEHGVSAADLRSGLEKWFGT